MYANKTHANRPTALTRADIARQRAAVAKAERERASRRMKARLARLAVIGGMSAVYIMLFYSF